MQTPRREFWLIAVLLFAASGCGRPDGPARGSVTGTVTIDGEPIPEGTISFDPTQGTKGPHCGGMIKDGAFSVPEERGPFPGKYLVAITGHRLTGEIAIDTRFPIGLAYDEKESIVPVRYRKDPDIVVDIVQGPNSFDLKLTSDPEPAIGESVDNEPAEGEQ